MLLWVNLHGGWLLGMALLAIYALAAFVESLRGSDAIARILSAHRARAVPPGLAVKEDRHRSADGVLIERQTPDEFFSGEGRMPRLAGRQLRPIVQQAVAIH